MLNLNKLQLDLSPAELSSFPGYNTDINDVFVSEFIYGKILKFAKHYNALSADDKPTWDNIMEVYNVRDHNQYYDHNIDIKNDIIKKWVGDFLEDISPTQNQTGQNNDIFTKNVFCFKIAGNYLGNTCLKFITTLLFMFYMNVNNL